jgi:small subunit ribosomal protein S16
MVRIRLRRVGKKKQPSYRVVIADSEFPRDGRFIEIIGFYNPRTDPVTVEIKADRALYWLGQGAQPSDPVARLLHKEGILAQFEAIKKGEPLPEPAAEQAEAETEEGAEVEAQAAPEAAIDAEGETEAEAATEAEAEDASETEAEPEEETETEA